MWRTFCSEEAKVLQWPYVWVYPTPTALAKPPKLDPNKSKVIYLRGTSGEVGAPCALAPESVFKRSWWWYCHATQWLEGSGLQGNGPLRMERPRWRWYLLPLFSTSKPSRNHPEMEQSRKTLSTVETTLLVRLSILPDKGSMDLCPENSLEP